VFILIWTLFTLKLNNTTTKIDLLNSLSIISFLLAKLLFINHKYSQFMKIYPKVWSFDLKSMYFKRNCHVIICIPHNEFNITWNYPHILDENLVDNVNTSSRQMSCCIFYIVHIFATNKITLFPTSLKKELETTRQSVAV